MGDSSKVTAAKPNAAGPIYIAPFGTSLPTKVSDTLAQAFKPLGLISEDGVEQSFTVDSVTVKDWEGKPVANMRTGFESSIAYKMLESINVEVLKAIYGSTNVTTDQQTGEIKVVNKGLNSQVFSVVVDTILKNGCAQRLVYPCATITGLDSIVYKANDVTMYGITLGLDADSTGTVDYKYIAVPQSSGGGEDEDEDAQ